ncbi:heme-binding protein [Komagataeibacter rhaeticus]|nr:heme-binding protein [Komagataeibacter rhaeticus]
MKLSQATTMLDAAHDEARRRGYASVFPFSMRRHGPWRSSAWMAPPGVIDVANRKARTAVLFQMDSADFARIGHPAGEAYMLEHTNGGLTSFGGGVVLRAADGGMLGGIGVSGASTQDDIDIARIAAATLVA